MAENKTKPNAKAVAAFIESFADTEQKKTDSYLLINLMQETTGFEPCLWGTSIIGFGSYHYQYQSGYRGDAPLVGFSPRKNAFSLYVFTGLPQHEYLLTDLGVFKKGKACLYIKKLADIDTKVLKNLIKETIKFLLTTYPQ